MLALQIGLVFVLILLNGFLSMSELAVVSSRPARLKALADAGNRGAARALQLSENPSRFLSTVQIGITLVGVLAGAFSGATLAEPFARALEEAGVAPDLAEPLSFASVVSAITILSLVVGELVPKQLALRNAEGIACTVARPLAALSDIAHPLVILLEVMTHAVLWLLGKRENAEQRVTAEEIKALVAEAETHGVVEPAEKAMIAGVMRLGNRPVRAVMTPRPEVEWVDLDGDPEVVRATIRGTRHSRLVAARGSVDAVEGIIRTRDLLDAYLDGRVVEPNTLVRAVPAVHDGIDALDVIDVLKGSDTHLALVVDEYGSLEGVVTTADILETIAGEFHEGGVEDEPSMVRRADGSYLLDGGMPVDEMAERLGLTIPDTDDYHTVAGFVLSALKHVPAAGEGFPYLDWRFEVMDMDGRRVDKVLATPNAGEGLSSIRRPGARTRVE